MRISVSMIVKNEQACLATALESVRDADEIVIVDTGSTDGTLDIARRYSEHVFAGPEFAWRDDFAFSRNQSLARCTGDWVIVVDADEELELGGIAKLREAIAGIGDGRTIDVSCISAKSGVVHQAPRIFRRCPEVFWKGAVHNYLSVKEHRQSDIRITYGYSEAHKRDPDRALRILTRELERNPKAVRETYYLAREYWYRKDYETAVQWFLDYLTRATWAPEMADAWLLLARCLLGMRQVGDAKDACLQAIKINADFREALLLMAELSGPKNQERWRAFAETASNEAVLFVRGTGAHVFASDSRSDG